jgi:hypothetical protein
MADTGISRRVLDGVDGRIGACRSNHVGKVGIADVRCHSWQVPDLD